MTSLATFFNTKTTPESAPVFITIPAMQCGEITRENGKVAIQLKVIVSTTEGNEPWNVWVPQEHVEETSATDKGVPQFILPDWLYDSVNQNVRREMTASRKAVLDIIETFLKNLGLDPSEAVGHAKILYKDLPNKPRGLSFSSFRGIIKS